MKTRKIFLNLLIITILLFSPVGVNAKNKELSNVTNMVTNSEFLFINDTTTTKTQFHDYIGADDSKSSFVCDDNIKKTINKYWKWIAFLTPALLLLFITIDFLKAMTSGEADSIKKSGSNALKRVIAAVILLILPTVIKIVFTWFGIENYLCY